MHTTLRRRLAAGMFAIITMAAAVFAWAVPAQAAATIFYGHRCVNFGPHGNGYRAAICADIARFGGTPQLTVGWAQAFCQRDTAPYTIVRCAGIVFGINVYRSTPGSGVWTMMLHSDNETCGTYSPYGDVCPTGRYETNRYISRTTTCSFYRSLTRASITLPGGTVASGGSVTSGDYTRDPPCLA
jgi:hypothetical protein